MSGPKISIYALTDRAMKNLSEQIRCDEQSFAYAGQVRGSIREMLGSRGDVDAMLGKLDLLGKRTGKGADEVRILTELKANLEKDCSAFLEELNSNAPVSSAPVSVSREALEKKRAVLNKLKAIHSKVSSYESAWNKALEKAGKQSAEHVSEIYENIAGDIGAASSFSTTYAAGSGDSESDFRTAYRKLEQKLTSLLPDTSCPAKIKAETKKALAALGNIHSLDYLRTFEAITVNPLRERYREFASHHAGVQEKYRERVARYVSLCSLVGCEAKKVPVTEEGAAFLETELSGLEKQLVRQREQEYISSCVDQVMAEMGYDLIGRRNVRKRSGKRFRNHLYSFGEGTAVNVTYSTDGQIAMELGGIDRGDRVPSPEETDMLCKDMESFCDSFAEMERRLRDKGVVIGKRIALSPPSPEFTSIINLNDYDVKTPESVASIAAGKKPKKASVKRSMRREND